MIQVTFLISAEADENLDVYVSKTFAPIMRALPGAEEITVMKMLASTTDAMRLRWQLQLRFADEDTMNTSFASVEGRRLSRELMDRQGAGVEMLTADLVE